MNLRNARYARDPRPLEEGCGCPACTGFSRAFIRHLVNQNEMLGLRLLSLHNLWLIHRLTAGARDAICRGAFDDFRDAGALSARRRLPGGSVQGLLIIVLLFGVLWFAMIRPQRAKVQAQQRMLGTVGARRRDPHRRRHLRHRPGARAGRGRGRPDRRDRRRHPRSHRAQGARDGDQARGRRRGRGRRRRRGRRTTTTKSSTARRSPSPTTRSPPPA